MKWTEPERLAYSMQLGEMRQEPTSNCSTCSHGKHIGWGYYECKRKPKGNADATIKGAVCQKWVING